MIKVYSHYDMDWLTRQFTADIKKRHTKMLPTDPEYLIVQTQGMKKYLALACARDNSIFTQVRTLMPKQFIMDMGFLLTGRTEKRSMFERDVLPWALYRLMKEGIDKGVPELQELSRYGGREHSEMRLFALAEKTADIFDQYMLYRPTWLHCWEADAWISSDPQKRDANEAWQKYLWRKLNTEIGSIEEASDGRKKSARKSKSENTDKELSPVRYMELLLATMKEGREESIGGLPKRVFLFGMSVMPPEYLKFFTRLGELIDVRMYLQMPTPEYYGDFLSDKQIQYRLRKSSEGSENAIAEAVRDNALLRNLGRVGQEFMNLLLDIGYLDAELKPGTEPPPSLPETLRDDASLLRRLQWDVQRCKRSDGKRTLCSEKSWSIRLAACYGPLREVEVVHDLLLECFDAEPGLTPADVLVVSPDLALYGPLVQMVFGDAQRRCGVHIPFTLADQSLLVEDKVARFAKDLLSAVTSRFEVSAIVPLFEAASDLSKKPLSAGEQDMLKRWCKNSGIRWGFDASFKTGFDLPADEMLTWRYGIDRLMAGFIMDDDDRLNGESFFPAVEVGESSAELFGRLGEFVDLLGALASEAHEKHEISQWIEFVAPLVAQMLDAEEALDDEGKNAAGDFGRALSKIRERTEVSKTKAMKFPFPIFMQSLIDELDDSKGGHGFSGAVTIANMVPMRSIPFKVVVMLGMNRGTFPRHAERPLFDLMAQYPPQKGDRDSLKTDRYTFLETLLSAEERLILTWSGFDSADGKKLAPSVVVDELMAYLDREYEIEGAKNTSEAVKVDFPLHPSSARYRSNSDGNAVLKTWNARWFEEAERRGTPAPLFAWDYPVDIPSQHPAIDGNAIIRVLSDPMNAFLTTCRIGQPSSDESLKSSELFDASSGLEGWGLRAAIQKERIFHEADAIGKYGAGGGIPPGTAGEQAILNYEPTIAAQLEWVKCVDPRPDFQMLRIDMAVDGTRFTLKSDHVSVKEKTGGAHERTAVFVDASEAGATKIITLWVMHLFLNLEARTRTTLVTIDRSTTLPPIAPQESIAHIRCLNDLGWKCRQRYLPFIPDVSWAYLYPNAEGVAGGKKEGWKEFDSILGNNESLFYKLDPYIKRAFNDPEDWDAAMAMIDGGEEAFKNLAQTVYGPYLQLIKGGQ